MRARLPGAWATFAFSLALAAYGCSGGSSSPPTLDAARTDGSMDRGPDLHADAVTDAPADAIDSASDAPRDGAGDTRDATDARDGAPADAGTDVAAPTCSDHVKNSDETDIDCGGHCGKCAPTQGCLIGADCSFGVCKLDHTCGDCNLASDCPGTETECVHRSCTAGTCGMSHDAAGTVLAQQTVGDCLSRQCASDGTVMTVANNSDVPDDRNACTNDTCTNGAPMHTMLPVNSSCGGQNRCNAAGQCVGCLTGTDCPGSDTACQTRTCSGQGVCGFTFTRSGTMLNDPTAGDCKGQQCDGAGNAVSFNDNTDLPVDGNPCTTDECSAGTPSHHPVGSGTACGTGLACDGANHCVACLSASTCTGTDTECHTRTCINGACGVSNTAAGTVTTAQVPRDCKRIECNGTGSTFTVPDVTDLPVDGNSCTNDVCNGDTPSNPPVTAGASCGASLMCDGAGQCVGCITVADCPGMDTACQTRSCMAGKCVVNNVPAGTLVGVQVAGNCQSTQCDTMGNVASVADPTDLPSDGTICTIDTCVGSTPTFTPVMQGTPCGDNGGSVCNATGRCVSCNVASDCPGGPDTDCHTRICSAIGTCSVMSATDGTVVSSQAGDCHKNVCNSGDIVPVVDDTDVFVDGNQCTQDLCSNGMVSNPVTAGAMCTENGGSLCDTTGTCVQCLADANCDNSHDTTCNKIHCVAGACMFVPEQANTAVADTTTGDCHKNVCDGMGAVSSIVDDTDVPATSSECVVTSCMGGAPSTVVRPHGFSCSQNGGRTCDGVSACVLTVSLVRLGTGAAALGNTATATFIEERRLDGTLISTVTLPSTEGPSHAFGLSGTATSEGELSLSADGRYLVVAGYNRAAGVSGNLANTASGTVNRMVARIDASGNVDTSTLLGANPFTANNVRGAASNDGQEFWVGGAGGTSAGVWYITFGQTTPAPVQVYGTNAVRWPEIFAGQLYVTTNQDTISSVCPVGSGLPTTAVTTIAPLAGLPTAAGPSPFSFVMFDRDPTVPGVDTLYIADDSTTAPNQGIQKWTLSGGGTWTQSTTFSAASSGTTPIGFRGLTGLVTGASNENVTLIATSGETNGTQDRLVVFIDGPSASATGTVVLTSATNTTYRGIALSPHL